MLKVLHFADAHIDIANRGRHDPQTGLPLRILDFLTALDRIIDAAIEERVDLVLFAGDAYKDRTPVPTFQREWDRRIMRLSEAGIPTLLLVGNHDLSPATGRAHAMQEFDTLAVPHIKVIGKPSFLRPSDMEGLPVQVLALPWVARSSLMASLELSAMQPSEIFEQLEQRLHELIEGWLEAADPSVPTILMAHTSVEGAVYGGERSVMLGNDLVLPGSMVRNPRLDYVALGHIHKAQNLNEGHQPPVIYPGSIERVDFGEAQDDKFFVIACIEKGKTTVEWRKIPGRRFIDCSVRLKSIKDLDPHTAPSNGLFGNGENNGSGGFSDNLPTPEQITDRLIAALPKPEEFTDTIVRLTMEYPRQWDPLIDEPALRNYTEPAFEFYFVRRPQMQARMRLPGDKTVNTLSPMELLKKYWETTKTDPDESKAMTDLARSIIESASQVEGTEETSGS